GTGYKRFEGFERRAHAEVDMVEDAGVEKIGAGDIGVMRVQFKRYDLPASRERAGQPDGAVAAQGSDFEDAPRTGDLDQQGKESALKGRDVDGGQGGLAVGSESGFESSVGGDEQVAEVAVHLRPHIRHVRLDRRHYLS